jgi:hypothetical protein
VKKMDNHIKKKGSDRPNKRGGVSSRGAPAPAAPRASGGGGGSRKGDVESCRDGSYGDTVLTPRDNHEHPRYYTIYRNLQNTVQSFFVPISRFLSVQ